jgi:hypothetical protein
MAAGKRQSPLLVLVCLYKDDITAVFVGRKLARVKAVRDKLRQLYGSAAAFHTINLNYPPKRWLEWEAKIRAELGLPPGNALYDVPPDEPEPEPADA